MRPVVPVLPIPAPAPKTVHSARSLVFDRVRLRIGVVDILNGVSFTTPIAGTVSIIDPSGAGKTGALNAITGTHPLTVGRILPGDRRIDSRTPHRVLGSGVGRKLQVPSVFSSMTVVENLALAMMANRARITDLFRPATLRWRGDALTRVPQHPGAPVGGNLNQPVRVLPQGHRQFLEYAMTVAAEPPVLLLNEPCAGLSPDETSLMTDLVRGHQRQTKGLVIVIEHDICIVEAISDKVLVLHQGHVLAFDSFAAVRADPEVQAVYVGGTK